MYNEQRAKVAHFHAADILYFVQLGIVGIGYVGLTTGVCFADAGNTVVCVDVDAARIAKLRGGVCPIHEPGLENLLKRNLTAGRLKFTTEYEQLRDAEIVFICVGTPTAADGSADTKYVEAACAAIDRVNGDTIIAIKSTAPPGTARRLYRNSNNIIVSIPEFLSEGSAVRNFQYPDRVVVGLPPCSEEHLNRLKSRFQELYAPFTRTGAPILFMQHASAELSKYAANAMLATRISLMNELAAIAEATGADIEEVRPALGADKRIGPAFLFAGLGFGCSCFTKDLKGLITTATARHDHMVDPHICDAVLMANAEAHEWPIRKLTKHFDSNFANKRVTLWGLSCKPNTDDIRDAPALTIAANLHTLGAGVAAYDPVAITLYDQGTRIIQCNDAYTAAAQADALIICTEWNEFRQPDWEKLRRSMRGRLILDGRNILDPQRATAEGFDYYAVGRSHLAAPLRTDANQAESK